MSRFPNRRRAVVSALIIGAGVLSSTFTVSPTSHNYGQVVVGTTKGGVFVVTFANTSGFTDTLVTQIVGPDAADFSVSLGGPLWVGAAPPAGSCLFRLPRGNGTCSYQVDFNPTSVGKKTATLRITDMNGKGTTAQATLLGEGLFTCRPYLVHCNYGDFYTGSITVITVDSTVASVNQMERLYTKLTVDVNQGVATCTGRQDDVTEERPGGTVTVRSTSAGPISGPGFFAVEFEPQGGKMIYRVSFACPTASLTHSVTDYLTPSNSGVSKTPADSADWKQHGITDDQPAARIGIDLIGTQLDLTSEAVNDKGGYTRMEWSLKKS